MQNKRMVGREEGRRYIARGPGVAEGCISPNMCPAKMFLWTAMPQRGPSYFHHKGFFVYHLNLGHIGHGALLLVLVEGGGVPKCHQLTKSCKV